MVQKLIKRKKVKEQLAVFQDFNSANPAIKNNLNIIEDESFDYKNINASEGIHGIHPYPAMMVYPIAKNLISTYSNEEELVLDPFVGSGTVLVESLLQNRNSIGLDLNPLALLLSKVKTTPLINVDLMKPLEKIIALEGKNKKLVIPKFFNLDFWFGQMAINRLSALLSEINQINSPEIRDFFQVAFSETVRLSSKSKNGEFKLVRMKEHENFDPDVYRTFEKTVLRNIIKIQSTYIEKPNSKVSILDWDSRIAPPIEENSIDLILTSPPYGDSKTTVAYGQFSRLSLQWLGYQKVNIDKDSLGGIISKETMNPSISKILNKTIVKIKERDEKRAREVYSFFRDLELCLSNCIPLLKTKGYACFIVGNRRVKQVTIPTDIILKEFCENLGLKYRKTISRNIPNKRMPSANSPTNAKGVKELTMNKEHIIILQNES